MVAALKHLFSAAFFYSIFLHNITDLLHNITDHKSGFPLLLQRIIANLFLYIKT